jgi:phage major head subunit gpT-like protein
MTAVPQIVSQFNVRANKEYNKTYLEFNPKFSDLLFSFNGGMRESNDFPYFEFLRTFEEFTGTRKYQTFPEGHNFRIVNKEWDMAVTIKMKNLERAAEAANLPNALNSLDIYKLRISEMAKMAKDFPIERSFQMMLAGDTTTEGTCFDLEPLFSNTHSYGPAAGTLSNIVTGTGTSVTQVRQDLLNVRSRFASFTYQQSPNATSRKLNRMDSKMIVFAPTPLDGVFWEVLNETQVNNSSNNVGKLFTYETLPDFVDQNDYYVAIVDEQMFKPFIHQIEKPPVLDLPDPNSERAKELKEFAWGAYMRMNVAYGAWWKIIKVTNA